MNNDKQVSCVKLVPHTYVTRNVYVGFPPYLLTLLKFHLYVLRQPPQLILLKNPKKSDGISTQNLQTILSERSILFYRRRRQVSLSDSLERILSLLSCSISISFPVTELAISFRCLSQGHIYAPPTHFLRN